MIEQVNVEYLREVRLYHWLKVKKFRKAGKDRKANRHLSYVQALNDLFPIGDTAEGDESKGFFKPVHGGAGTPPEKE